MMHSGSPQTSFPRKRGCNPIGQRHSRIRKMALLAALRSFAGRKLAHRPHQRTDPDCRFGTRSCQAASFELDYIPESGNPGTAAAVPPILRARFRGHDTRLDMLIALLAATAIVGCTPAQSPPPTAAAPAAAVSWDGTY